MLQPKGKKSTLYEQVLEHARQEIDEAASNLDELRRSLQVLEARVEAAKAVYESVAARLNLEDEVESGFPAAPYQAEPAEPAVEAPEPEVETQNQAEVHSNGSPEGFSMDLIQKDLEQRQVEAPPDEPELPQKLEAPPPIEPAPPAEAPATAPISADAMDLIRRHLEQKSNEGDEAPPPEAPPPAPMPESNEEGESSGFELADADKQLIHEYLRSKREG